MSQCVFKQANGKLTCIKCGRSVKTNHAYVRRVCQIQTPLFPCVFVESNGFYQPWTLVWLDKVQIETYNAIQLNEDASRVGSRFASVASLFKSGSCNCERLKTLLDAASVGFIGEYFDSLVTKIHESANMGRTIKINRVFVAAALSLCLKLERITHGL